MAVAELVSDLLCASVEESFAGESWIFSHTISGFFTSSLDSLTFGSELAVVQDALSVVSSGRSLRLAKRRLRRLCSWLVCSDSLLAIVDCGSHAFTDSFERADWAELSGQSSSGSLVELRGCGHSLKHSSIQKQFCFCSAFCIFLPHFLLCTTANLFIS